MQPKFLALSACLSLNFDTLSEACTESSKFFFVRFEAKIQIMFVYEGNQPKNFKEIFFSLEPFFVKELLVDVFELQSLTSAALRQLLPS